MDASPIWLAYCAGVVERRNPLFRKGQRSMRLISGNGELIERWQETFQCGRARVLSGDFITGKQYEWKSESYEDTVRIVNLLLPFLTRRTADQYVGLRDSIMETDAWKASQASS